MLQCELYVLYDNKRIVMVIEVDIMYGDKAPLLYPKKLYNRKNLRLHSVLSFNSKLEYEIISVNQKHID